MSETDKRWLIDDLNLLERYCDDMKIRIIRRTIMFGVIDVEVSLPQVLKKIATLDYGIFMQYVIALANAQIYDEKHIEERKALLQVCSKHADFYDKSDIPAKVKLVGDFHIDAAVEDFYNILSTALKQFVLEMERVNYPFNPEPLLKAARERLESFEAFDTDLFKTVYRMP